MTDLIQLTKLPIFLKEHELVENVIIIREGSTIYASYLIYLFRVFWFTFYTCNSMMLCDWSSSALNMIDFETVMLILSWYWSKSLISL